jgi:hypothetical protein
LIFFVYFFLISLNRPSQVGECPNKDKVCSLCGKTGHLMAKCRGAPAPSSGGAAYYAAPPAAATTVVWSSGGGGGGGVNKTCDNCGEVLFT